MHSAMHSSESVQKNKEITQVLYESMVMNLLSVLVMSNTNI